MQFQCKILSCIHSGSKFWNIRLMKCWIHIYHHINRYGFKYIFKWSAWLPWFSLFYHESSPTSHAKIKKYIVTPQDTPPDPPQDDHTNYELKKEPMSYNPYYRQQKTSSCNHLSFHYSKSFLAQKKSLSALNCFKCNFISWHFTTKIFFSSQFFLYTR